MAWPKKQSWSKWKRRLSRSGERCSPCISTVSALYQAQNSQSSTIQRRISSCDKSLWMSVEHPQNLRLRKTGCDWHFLPMVYNVYRFYVWGEIMYTSGTSGNQGFHMICHVDCYTVQWTTAFGLAVSEPLSLDVEPDSATCRWELGQILKRNDMLIYVARVMLMIKRGGRRWWCWWWGVLMVLLNSGPGGRPSSAAACGKEPGCWQPWWGTPGAFGATCTQQISARPWPLFLHLSTSFIIFFSS